MMSLPVDRTVRVVRVSSNEISFVWRASPSLSSVSGAVKYCLAVGQLRHFRTRCAATGFMDGDPEPMAPPHAGFGFTWEQEAARRQRDRAKQRQRSAAAAESGISPLKSRGGLSQSNDIGQRLFYTCVGSATNYTFRLVKFNNTYRTHGAAL